MVTFVIEKNVNGREHNQPRSDHAEHNHFQLVGTIDMVLFD